MKFKSAIVATAAMLVSAASASAQGTTLECTGSGSSIGAGCQVTNTVSSTVPYVARLILSHNNTTLTAPTAVNFGTTAGVDNANALTLDVRSNVTYLVTASAATPNFTGGAGTKLSSSITYTTDGGSNYKVLAGAGSSVGSGAATNNDPYTIGYKTLYNWTVDVPGTYSLVINYTLTTP